MTAFPLADAAAAAEASRAAHGLETALRGLATAALGLSIDAPEPVRQALTRAVDGLLAAASASAAVNHNEETA